MAQVVQAFDRAPTAEVAADDTASLDAKLGAATRAFRDRQATGSHPARISLAGLKEFQDGISFRSGPHR